jgi:hypothetical protein
MKTNLPTQVGIGFTIVVAAATFLVAVVAALFLIWQPDAETLSQQRAASQISLAASPDVRRGPETAQPPAPLGGINPTPQPVQ